MTAASPVTARLLLGSAAASLAALWIAAQVMQAPLARLHAARSEWREIAARAKAPPAAAGHLLPPREAISAASRAAAARLLDRTLRQRALQGALLVETLEIAPDARATPLIEAMLTVSGSESALLRFVAETEQAQPLVRFAAWRLEAGSGSAVRLTGRVVAAWERPR
jgi:hypothetical protein